MQWPESNCSGGYHLDESCEGKGILAKSDCGEDIHQTKDADGLFEQLGI
ncbi:hypothetical protein [Photorhabdus heterorhabditis]|nr:hypothetical protein [Photorhabdus heterorhabditis]